MNIIVAGCGKIGISILANLVLEGHNVTAIDSDADVVREVTDIYDVIGVNGNCVDCETLEQADVTHAQLFVAVTDSDEENMLSCFLAKQLGAGHTIARIRNPEYNDHSLGFMRQKLCLSMSVNPELLTAQELYHMLKLPSAVKIEYFSRRSVEMVELRLRSDSLLNNVALKDLSWKFKGKYLVCVVQRGDEIHIPDGNFVLQSGDRIHLTAAPAEIQRLLKAIGVLKKQARSIMILGGSRTAYYLAKMLLASGADVKIIESDRERCRELCKTLPKAVVINGDGAQQELLLEEGIESVDAFVALTGMDEENILISYFAMQKNVPKVIAKVNRSEFLSTAEALGLDSIVSLKDVTSDILVRYARALENSLGSNVETLYKLKEGRAEVLEFNVAQDARVINIPLRDLHLKDNTLIAGILRGRKTIIPSGDDMICVGDKVIVVSAAHRLHDLSDILKSGKAN